MLHGNATQLLWGSDYPHLEGTFVNPEGRDTPSVTRLALRHTFCHTSPETPSGWSGGNAIDIYGLDADALRTVADEIGAPTLDELATPIDAVPGVRASPPSVPAPAAGAEDGRTSPATCALTSEIRRRTQRNVTGSDEPVTAKVHVAVENGGPGRSPRRIRRLWAPVRRWRSCASRSSGVTTGVSSGRCSRTSATSPW